MNYTHIYKIFNLSDLPCLYKNSKSLNYYLRKVQQVVLLCGTLGPEVDRKINRLQSESMAEAYQFDKQCLDFLEAQLDETCAQIETEHNFKLKPRFSPGFGDLPLSINRYIVEQLGAAKALNISLTETDYFMPSKTVAAIIGIKPNDNIK